MDGTTSEHEHGFRHIFTHTSEQVVQVTEWITAPCMTTALSLPHTHTHTHTHTLAVFDGGMPTAALVPTTIMFS